MRADDKTEKHYTMIGIMLDAGLTQSYCADDDRQTKRTMTKTIVMPQEVFAFMVRVVDMTTIAVMLRREQMELFQSRAFRVFLDAQKESHHFVTRDTKHYELLVVLLSGQSKEELQEVFHKFMEMALGEEKENAYLRVCRVLKTMWNNLEMLRQEISVYDIQEVKFADKTLHILLNDG